MPIIGVIASADKNVPNAPTIGTATDVGTSRAFTPQNGGGVVTFTAPTFTGNSPILDYTATSSPSGFTATGAGSPLTVNGLAPNTNYTFTVTARNAIGSSAASAASNTMLSTTVPQAPTIGTATDGGTGTTVSVAFIGNATGGKAISTYTATSSPGGFTGTGASSPITVSGLTAGTAYTFTVTATNANGTSGASSPSNSVTPVVPSSFDSIATISGSGTSSVTFSGISGSYKSLQIRGIYGVGTTSTYISLRLNGSTSSIYYPRMIRMTNGGGVGNIVEENQNQLRLSNELTSINTFASYLLIDLPDYANTTKNKGVIAVSGQVNKNFAVGGGGWTNTAAITSVTIFTNDGTVFNAATSFALYGRN